MNTFPTLPVPSDFKQKIRKESYRVTFEQGTPASVLKWPTARWKYEISWSNLSDTEMESLASFFDSNAGIQFNFTHPITSSSKVAIFENDELEFAVSENYDSATGKPMWSTSVNLIIF